MNKLLQRQIQKHFGELSKVPEEFNRVLMAISESYDHYEKERKMLERAIDLSSMEMITGLKKETEELNEAQQIAHIGSWKWNRENNMSVGSAEFYKILERDSSQLLQTFEGFIECIHPEDRRRVQDVFKQCLANHQSFSWEARIVVPNGQVKTIEAQGKLIENAQGQVLNIHGTIQDVTEQKQSEIALQKAHNQLQTLFENIEEVFFSVDMRNNQLLQISHTCEKVYGHSREDFYTNPNLWYELVVAEDKHVVDANHKVMCEGKHFNQEFRITRMDNSIRWIETKITPTLDSMGSLTRIDGVAIDITERKEAEEKLRKNNEELKKANMELDEFVYISSHDLRAPLTSVMGLVSLTETLTEEPLIKQHLQMVKGSVKKLDGFILEILNYSRNSRLEIKKEKVDFREVINDITDNHRYMSSQANTVEIKSVIKGETPFFSDKNRLAIILNNLVSNAIRYYNPKEKKPFVSIEADISEKVAQIMVKDNGMGINKEFHKKVFDMFYRLSENSIGSGLGLYIVKESINKLSGTIDIDSEPGIGTTFTISIPNN